MAQANPTSQPVEDIRDVAGILTELRELLDPADGVALDFLSGKLLDSAAQIEAQGGVA